MIVHLDTEKIFVTRQWPRPVVGNGQPSARTHSRSVPAKHAGPTRHRVERACPRLDRWAFGPSINPTRLPSCSSSSSLPRKSKLKKEKKRVKIRERRNWFWGRPELGVGLARVLAVGSRRGAADGGCGGGGEAVGGCRRGDGGVGALLVHHCGGLRREDRPVRPRAPGLSPLLFHPRHCGFLVALAS